MLSVIDNLRLALRDIRRRPTFTATVVLTLAVGIAATTAAFALVDAVFLARLPVRDQDQLVVIWAAPPTLYASPGVHWPVPWEFQQHLIDERHAFDGVAAFRAEEPYPYAGRADDRMLHVEKTSVSGNFFDVLGVQPELGRLLRPDDDVRGAPDIVVLSDQLWRRDFNSDPHVIGRLIFFAGAPRRVIGVAPPEFSFPAGTSVWVPVVQESHARWNLEASTFGFYLVGRLAPGATRTNARGEVEAVLRSDTPAPAYTAGYGALPTTGVVERYMDVVLGADVRPGVVILFSAVALVLVIACTNVAGLFLARGISRAVELAVRAALGASRWQLVGYLLTESALLAAAGGAVGVAAAAALVRAAVALAPPELPMVRLAHLDPPVLAFAAAITIVSAIGFGLAPALRAARSEAHEVLRAGSRSVTGGRMSGMVRRVLVAAQVALALVVLSGAALLGRTLADLQGASLGFDPSHLLFFRLDVMLPESATRDSSAAWTERQGAFRERLVERALATSELGPMTTSLWVPLTGPGPSAAYTVDGQLPVPGSPTMRVQFDHGLDDYFGVMGIALIRGRSFNRRDDLHAPAVAVVNEEFANQVWPGHDPIGHRLRFPSDSIDQWWTIVGVVADARYNELATPPPPMVYTAGRQGPWLDPWYVIRTRGNPGRAASVLEHVIGETDPAFGISRTTNGPDLLAARLARPRALAALFAALAATALALAAIGLFGVLSAYVRERRREIAIRSALGATAAQLRSLVMGQTLGIATAGIAFGFPLGIGASHILRAMVRDVQPANIPTILAVASVLLVVVACATYGPMARASRVDARTALAAE